MRFIKGRGQASGVRCQVSGVGLALFLFSLIPGTWNLTPSLHADRLRATGLETNNFTQTEWALTSGAGLSIATTSGCPSVPHSGTYNIRINQTASTAYGRMDIANQASGTVYIRAFFCFTTRSGANVPMFQLSSGGNGSGVNYISSGTTWQIENNGGVGVATGTTVLATGQWYRFELRVLVSDTVGEVEGRLYSDMDTTPLETLSLTAQDTLPATLTQLYIGAWFVNTTCDIYIDDIIINNSAGSAPFNTWAGPSKLALLKPASDQTVTWTKVGAGCTGSTNFDCVNDVPGTPDDATTYNSSATANNEDRLNSTALPAEVPSDADMISLTVYDRWDGNGVTGTRTGRHLIWDEASAQTNGPTHSRCDVAAGTWSIASSAEITGFNLGTRTKANVESFDLGYEPINAAECRVTAIWANVEWKPAPAAPSCAQSIALLGVGCR